MLITAAQTASFLQSVAKTVFKLKVNDKSLRRWTSHSICVTAANLLHRQGYSDTYIQSRLRWKSNAFLDYLRNTLYTASAHTKALHIPQNNLPHLSTGYIAVTHPIRRNSPHQLSNNRHANCSSKRARRD